MDQSSATPNNFANNPSPSNHSDKTAFDDAAPGCSPESFMGDFAEATHDLLMEDSAASRAAAAHRLAHLGRPLASPYLIAALADNAWEVRQAAAESLGLVGDAEAIAPLQDLLSRGNQDALLQQAISSAISSISARAGSAAASKPANATPVHEVRGSTQAPTSAPENSSHGNLNGAGAITRNEEMENWFANPVQEELLRSEETALREAKEDLERRRAESERLRAEGDKQRLAELEATRLKAETEARQRIERERQLAAEIEELHKAEADQLKRIQEASAEARRRSEEAARQLAETEARERAAKRDRAIGPVGSNAEPGGSPGARPGRERATTTRGHRAAPQG